MIEPKRLEELIKQGATIIRVTGQGLSKTISKFKFDPNCDYGFDDYDLNTIYETEDHYNWQRKTYIERTERFEPPMWEDLVTPYHFTFIIRSEKDSSDMGVYGLHIFQSGIIIEEDIESAHSQHYLFDKDFTKENYEKACEIVRDLFGGENIEK